MANINIIGISSNEELEAVLNHALNPMEYADPLGSNKASTDKTALTHIELSVKCEECSGNYVQRNGKFGSFYGCSNYPNCRSTKNEVT